MDDRPPSRSRRGRPSRPARPRVLRRHEGQHAVAGDDVVDELDRALLSDRERRHRLREDDGLLEREHRQRGRDLDVALEGLGLGHVVAARRRPDRDRHPSQSRRRGDDGQLTIEQALIVDRAGPLRVDVHGQSDAALERSVLDLEQVVGEAALRVDPVAPPGDHESTLVDGDVHVGRVDPGELDNDRQLVRVVGADDVDARTEAAPLDAEARAVPELGEHVLELGVQALHLVGGHGGQPSERLLARDARVSAQRCLRTVRRPRRKVPRDPNGRSSI